MNKERPPEWLGAEQPIGDQLLHAAATDFQSGGDGSGCEWLAHAGIVRDSEWRVKRKKPLPPAEREAAQGEDARKDDATVLDQPTQCVSCRPSCETAAAEPR